MARDYIIHTPEDVAKIRVAAAMAGKARDRIAEFVRPGMSTKELDMVAGEVIHSMGGKCAFLGYHGYPGNICISVNDEVVHGIPSKHRHLKEGDIVSIDCGVVKNGFYGDSAYTFEVGSVSDDLHELLEVTKKSLYIGIENAVAGKRVGDIGYAIQAYCEAHGYSVVRELVGHGVGRELHEEPAVPNYGKRGQGVKLKEGMVIAIEPMIVMGERYVYQDEDGWSIKTRDKSPAAHFEHTIAITNEGVIILTGDDV